MILAARRRSVTLGSDSLAAARSHSGSDSHPRLSFIALVPLRYIKGCHSLPSPSNPLPATKNEGKRLRFSLVGVRGFEPPASWSRTKHSTKLSHTPINILFSAPLLSGAQNIISQYTDFVNIVLQKTFFATTKFSHFAVALVIAHPFMI